MELSPLIQLNRSNKIYHEPFSLILYMIAISSKQQNNIKAKRPKKTPILQRRRVQSR